MSAKQLKLLTIELRVFLSCCCCCCCCVFLHQVLAETFITVMMNPDDFIDMIMRHPVKQPDSMISDN